MSITYRKTFSKKFQSDNLSYVVPKIQCIGLHFGFNPNSETNRIKVFCRLQVACTVLPPSHKKIPISLSSRENSGISLKRHRLRILLNEHYLLMYNIKFGRHRFNVQIQFCQSSESTSFSFFVITRDWWLPRS